jgi:flagellin
MSLRINHNLSSLNAYRHLQETQANLSTSLERLSSGMRINHAADDAAGLGISEKLRAQISGYDNAVRNAQDGISIIQTADGALDRVHTILRRIRDLSELAANGDKTDEDRSHYQEEVNQLLSEVDRIGSTTEYNKRKLLDGTLGSAAKIAGDIDDIANDASLKVESAPVVKGEYKVQITDSASKANATFTAGAAGSFTTSNTFSDFVGGTDGTYTFKFTVDGKETTVDLVAKAGAVDTIQEAINKINDAFKANGVEAHATFTPETVSGSGVSGIKIESDKFGSAHDIKINLVNQPGGVYAPANYNADDGTTGAIYNSDRSDANGVINASTVVFGDGTTSNMKSLLNSSYWAAGHSITFTDRDGNSADLAIDSSLDANGDNNVTVQELVDGINGLGININAIYDQTNGRINIVSTSANGTGPIKIKGTGDTDSNNELASMLGLYGEYYGSEVKGEKLSSTWDFHLKITDPNNNQVDVFNRFGSRDTHFAAVESGSAITESGVDPDRTGEEQPGTGGISGISFDLNEKTYRGDEKFSIMVSGGSLSLQIGANGGDDNRMRVSIDKMDTKTLGIDHLDISTQDNAQNVLDSSVLDNAIDTISTQRAKLGAMQNRLNHSISNLSVTMENLQSAESRIRDTDFAKETLAFTRSQILAQSGTAMLRQANTLPQQVLQACYF